MGDRVSAFFGVRARTPHPHPHPAHQPDSPGKHANMTADDAPATTQRSLQRSLTDVPTKQVSYKTPRLSRISSLIGLGASARTQSPTTSAFPELIMQRSESMKFRTVSYHEAAHDRTTGIWRSAATTVESEYGFRESDRTWHNPNVVQMMETVSCALMTNGIAEPIPRHLNGSIASMIEEFRIHLSKLKTLQATHDELQHSHKNEIQEFAAMAEEWKVHEIAFRAEIKRLEQIIASTQAGAESVILARAGSIVNRKDGKAFQARLNRLSRSECRLWKPQTLCKQAASLANNIVADEGLDHNNERLGVTGKEINHSNILSPTDDNTLGKLDFSRPPRDRIGVPSNNFLYSVAARPRMLLDHYSDVYLSEKLRAIDSPSRRHVRDGDLGQRMAAAKEFFDTTGRPRPPSNTSSKKTSPPRKPSPATASSSSSISQANSSGSSIAQGHLDQKVNEDHISPHTTPCGTQAAKGETSTNALATIQELMKANGGFPEDAIDDESSYAPSFVPSHNAKALSLDVDDGKAASCDGLVTNLLMVKTKEEESVHNRSQRPSQLSAVPEMVSISRFSDGVNQDGETPAFNGVKRHDSNQSHNSSNSFSSQNSHRSSILLSMGRNLMEEVGSDAEGAQGADGACDSSSSSETSIHSTRSSPTRKAQSGEQPVPDQATIDAARIERTVTNYVTKTRSFLRTEDLCSLPPQYPASVSCQQRVRYTDGPPPGFSARPVIKPFQQTRRHAKPDPSKHASTDATQDQDSTAATCTALSK